MNTLVSTYLIFLQMIRYKLSTATLLEIVSTAKSLRYLYVRRNVILKKFDFDWLNISDWSPEHCRWIKDNCHSYEKTEQEISRILGYRWHMLSEKEFAKQTISLHV
jgi:F-box protein 39